MQHSDGRCQLLQWRMWICGPIFRPCGNGIRMPSSFRFHSTILCSMVMHRSIPILPTKPGIDQSAPTVGRRGRGFPRNSPPSYLFLLPLHYSVAILKHILKECSSRAKSSYSPGLFLPALRQQVSTNEPLFRRPHGASQPQT